MYGEDAQETQPHRMGSWLRADDFSRAPVIFDTQGASRSPSLSPILSGREVATDKAPMSNFPFKHGHSQKGNSSSKNPPLVMSNPLVSSKASSRPLSHSKTSNSRNEMEDRSGFTFYGNVTGGKKGGY